MRIPRPFAIAIDDMGWMHGANEGYQGKGPYRIGIKREIGIDDYEAVVALAKKVGVRLQGLFILGELDREGVAQSIPTVLPNPPYWKAGGADLQLQVMDFVKSNSAHLEFGLHGVGHEYWPDDSNNFKRAEWYNLIDKEPWPKESLKAHLDCFVDIMAQYDLTPSNNQSFPESFVPCAYSYYWNPQPSTNEYSLGALLSEYGVRYANTDFSKIPERNPPIDGGFDNGVHVMNRFNYGNLWHMIGQLPMIPLKYQNTDFIESHWPNLLAQDTFLQESVTDLWVAYFNKVNESPDRYYSKNTAQHHSQFLYCKYTKIIKSKDGFILDNSGMPDNVDHDNVLQNLVIKVPLKTGEHLEEIKLNGIGIPAYYEVDGYAHLFLSKLTMKISQLTYKVSFEMPKEIIWHDSTSNILNIRRKKKITSIEGRYYGQQSIKFLTEKSFSSVSSNNPLLKINDWSNSNGVLVINVSAIDIQGVSANLILSEK